MSVGYILQSEETTSEQSVAAINKRVNLLIDYFRILASGNIIQTLTNAVELLNA